MSQSNPHPVQNSQLSSVKGSKFSAWLDRRVRAIAAGLSIAELRAMARGDPPTERPNPRYRAHVSSMLLHIRPRSYFYASTWFTHTFRLGFITTFLFVVEIITGIILMVYYDPTPAGAYESILRINSEVLFGEYLRDIHRLAAEAMVIVAALHMLRTFLTASYKGERRFTWLTGMLLLLITLLLAFSGYLLPWDQLAYWAVTIGTSMAASVPLLGERLVLLLRGPNEIGADGLLRFYLLHVVLLPLLGAVVLSVHYYRVARIHGISLPAQVEEGNLSPKALQEAKRKIDFIPDLFWHEIMLINLGILVLFIAAYLFYDAPLESHADPMRTPLGTQAPWFFLWVQGLLKLGDKTTWGVIVPMAFFVLLFAIPYVDRNPSRMARKRPLAIGLGLLTVGALIVLSFMGTASYGIPLDAAISIGQEIAPEEGSGEIHEVPFDQLRVGVYQAGAVETADLPPLFGKVVDKFNELVHLADKDGKLPELQAWMIVEEQQANLKHVTLRMQWVDPESGRFRNYEHRLYLHQDHQAIQGERDSGMIPGLGAFPSLP